MVVPSLRHCVCKMLCNLRRASRRNDRKNKIALTNELGDGPDVDQARPRRSIRRLSASLLEGDYHSCPLGGQGLADGRTHRAGTHDSDTPEHDLLLLELRRAWSAPALWPAGPHPGRWLAGLPRTGRAGTSDQGSARLP